MRFGVLALLLLAAAGAAGAAPQANVGLVFTQDVGRLHASDDVAHRYLCAVSPSGTNGRKVTSLDGRVLDPDVSPSGADVAYVEESSDGLVGRLAHMPTAGGGAIRPLGDTPVAWPVWWSDSNEIVFSSPSGGAAGDMDLYGVGRLGGVRLIAGGPSRETMATVADYWLAFVRSSPSAPRTAPGALWMMNLTGFARRLLPDGAANPDLSYDATRVVYESPEGIRVLTIEPEFSVGPVLAQGTQPVFSPDSARIAFVRDGDVWTMSATGGEEVNVTHSPVPEAGPTWQGTPVPTGTDEPCALVGTPGDDVVTGSEYADVVFDGDGDDVYRTLGGDDWVFDGAGADRYETGDGADRATLVAGPDTTDGGPGDDTLRGTQGPDRLLGGEGDDTIYGLRGADVIFGGPGNDRIEGNRGDDSIDGGLGDDVLYGGIVDGAPASYDGYDLLLGRGGNDRLAGGWQKDRLFGGPGHDLLAGGAHADHLVGEAGRDTILGEGGDDLVLARDRTRDRIYGGPGFDRARLDAVDRRGGIERLLR